MLGMTAEEIGVVLVGLSLAISTILGGRKGRDALKAKPVTGTDMVEVAGAIISDKKANEIIAALEAHGHCLERNTKACNGMAGKLDPLGETVRDLAKEYEIASRLGRSR